MVNFFVSSQFSKSSKAVAESTEKKEVVPTRVEKGVAKEHQYYSFRLSTKNAKGLLFLP